MTEPPSDGEWPPAAGDLIFIGGTGRSGTHVLARLLDRHPRFAGVPIESRFHCNKRGMPDLLGGRVTLAGLRREAARLLVAPRQGRRPAARPLQPADPRAVRRRVGALRARLPARPGGSVPAAVRGAARGRWPPRRASPGLVEMSSHNVREAQTLRRLFPRGALRPRGSRRARRRLVGGHQDLGPRQHRSRGSTGGRIACARSRPECAARRTAPRTRSAPSSSSWSLSTTSSGAIARRPTAGCSTSSRWTTTRRCASSSTTR